MLRHSNCRQLYPRGFHGLLAALPAVVNYRPSPRATIVAMNIAMKNAIAGAPTRMSCLLNLTSPIGAWIFVWMATFRVPRYLRPQAAQMTKVNATVPNPVTTNQYLRLCSIALTKRQAISVVNRVLVFESPGQLYDVSTVIANH